MRTSTERFKAAYKALRAAIVRAWNTVKLVVRAVRNGTHATGGYLPPGAIYARNATGRPERVATPYPPPARGRGSSDHRNGHLGQRRG